MFMIKNKTLVLTLLFSSIAALGSPAFSAAPQVASVQLGVALPLVGDLDDIADPGLSIGAQVMHKANARHSYGVGVNYYSFGEDSEQQVNTEVSVISTMMMAHHALSDKGSGTPFIETGLGFARTQVNIETSNAGGPAIVRGSNEEDISPTFLIGAGFDTPISGGATFGFSVDYQHFFFKVGDVDGGGSLNVLAHLRM